MTNSHAVMDGCPTTSIVFGTCNIMPQQDVIQIVEYGTWERWLEARECGLHVLASVLGKTMLRLDSDLGEDVNGGGRWMATWPGEA
ncbi:hypothetical protein HPP92_008035 [Vanilla planifolia]|uniref:Uncharacterized protein n=1 Tax=Vanilla planifolia TaxID=51239 RepID=A0A835RHS1_VANPL|nr:hypothetical protein HPP92_008035 [Vanilla planifolia]